MPLVGAGHGGHRARRMLRPQNYCPDAILSYIPKSFVMVYVAPQGVTKHFFSGVDDLWSTTSISGKRSKHRLYLT
eukprot:626793-Prymnesium_polylepis.1